jgi:hypothetical protein
MNGIERGKAGIENVYTNYMPFYITLYDFVLTSERNIQNDFREALYRMDEAKINAAVATPQPTPTPWNPNPTPGRNQPLEGTTPMPEVTLAPGETPDPSATPSPPPPTAAPVDINDTREMMATLRIPLNAGSMNYRSNRIQDAGMFRVSQVRATNDNFGFLDMGVALTEAQARNVMLGERAHVNRIADSLARMNVNFFVHLGVVMQYTSYYNTYVDREPGLRPHLDEFLVGLNPTVTGVSYLDIDTIEKRLSYMFLTDHHWNAFGSYKAYTQVINMMREVVPELHEPYPLLRAHVFSNVHFRGSGASRTRTPTYYDIFAVPIIGGMPEPHPTQRIQNQFDAYNRGWNNNNTRPASNPDYTGHYEAYFHHTPVITYPTNQTGRKLLFLGDSYSYWVLEPISAHFDVTYFELVMGGGDFFIEDLVARHGITDVLLLQYGPRTLAKATSAAKGLEQIRTR